MKKRVPGHKEGRVVMGVTEVVYIVAPKSILRYCEVWKKYTKNIVADTKRSEPLKVIARRLKVLQETMLAPSGPWPKSLFKGVKQINHICMIL